MAHRGEASGGWCYYYVVTQQIADKPRKAGKIRTRARV